MTDRRLDAVVCHAATEHPVHALPDFLIRRVRIPIQQRLGGQDLTVLAIAALRYLVVDPSLLNGVEFTVAR
jgi:hypothetical protein